MADISITIQNADKLEAALKNFPTISKPRINTALQQSIFEIQKRTNDSGDSGLFQFKTPRAKRTGYLARSFAFGITYGNLFASIGPTAVYAPYVYYGTSRGIIPNAYMDRIATDAQKDIEQHFQDAGDAIVQDIANQSQ